MKKILLLAFTITTASSYAQISDWLIAFDSSDFATDVAIDDQGSAYVSGKSSYAFPQARACNTIVINGSSCNSPNIKNELTIGYLAKIDSNAALKWCRMMTTAYPYEIFVASTAVDRSNNALVLVEFGDTLKVENDTIIFLPSTLPHARYNNALVKFDGTGNFLWAQVLPGKVDERQQNLYNPFDKIIIGDRNEIYVGYDTILPQFDNYGYILKYDSLGNLLQEIPRVDARTGDFTVDKNKDIIMSWSHYDSDTLLVRYDSLGTLKSILSCKGKGFILRMELDTAGNLYAIGGMHNSFTVGAHNLTESGGNHFILKINSSGHVEWLKKLETCQDGYLHTMGGLAITRHNRILVSGTFINKKCFDSSEYSSSYPNDSGSFFIYAIDPDGNLIWEKYGTGNGFRYSHGLEYDYRHDAFYHIASVSLGSFQTDTLHVDQLAVSTKFTGGYLLRVFDGSNLISGRVYSDNNSNGIPDASDRFFRDRIITVSGAKNGQTFTDRNGYFQFYARPGTYSIFADAPRHHSMLPALHSAAFTSFNQTDTANNFNLTLNPNINDLRVKIISGYWVWRGKQQQHDLLFSNAGSTTLTNNCVLKMDTNAEFISADSTPDQIVGNEFTWQFQNMQPYESMVTKIKFDAKGAIGDTLNHIAKVGLALTDSFPQDNIDSAQQILLGSWDPNFKSVQPMGDVKPSYVQEGNYFTYTIHFQNTGTAPAEYVRIRDTISDNLEITSFEMFAASHNYELKLTNSNVIDFIFNDIMLPDSGADYEGSQGYVCFDIKADPTLNHGDYFDNTAHIYFDNNEAVVTNTAHTLISDWASVQELVTSPDGLMVYPNPSNGVFTLKFTGSEYVDITIADLAGKVVYARRNVATIKGETKLSDLGLDRGIYFITVNSENVRRTAKLMVIE